MFLVKSYFQLGNPFNTTRKSQFPIFSSSITRRAVGARSFAPWRSPSTRLSHYRPGELSRIEHSNIWTCWFWTASQSADIQTFWCPDRLTAWCPEIFKTWCLYRLVAWHFNIPTYHCIKILILILTWWHSDIHIPLYPDTHIPWYPDILHPAIL